MNLSWVPQLPHLRLNCSPVSHRSKRISATRTSVLAT
jgi:hypothetical protein